MNGSITYDTRRADPLGSDPSDPLTGLGHPSSFDGFSPYHDDHAVIDFFDDDAQRITSVVACVFAIHFALIFMLSPHFIMPDLLPDEPDILPVQIVSFDPTPQIEPEADPEPEIIRPAIPAVAPRTKPRPQIPPQTEPEPQPTPPPQPEPKPDPVPVITPPPQPEPEPIPEPEPVEEPEPTITPSPDVISQPVLEPEPDPEPAPIPDPIIEPDPVIEPEPVTEPEPITPDPIIEEPVTEEPIVDDPVIEDPVIEEPIVEPEPEVTPAPIEPEPIEPEPIEPEPVPEPVLADPITSDPLIEEPIIEEPLTEELEPFTTPDPIEDLPLPGPIVEDPLSEIPPVEDTPLPIIDPVVEPEIIETPPSPETIDPPDVLEETLPEPAIITTAPSILASPDAPITPQETERAIPQSQSNPLRDLLERPVGNPPPNPGRGGPTIAGPLGGGGNEAIPGGGTRRAAPGTSGWTLTPSGRKSPGAGYDGLVLDIRCREAGRTHLDCPEYLNKFRGRDANGFESFKGLAGRGTDRGPQAPSAAGRSATAGHVGGGQNIWVVPLGDNSFNNGGPSTTILDDGPEVSFDREFLNKPVRIDDDKGRLRDLFQEPDKESELPDWMLPEKLPDPEPE